jgi:endonuclease/exonuclease/phosphatase (EEP) superfamily protein YafD
MHRREQSARPSRFGRILWGAVGLFAGAAVVAFFTIRLGGDRHWLATPLLFGPRWLFATPAVLLAPAALLARRPWALAATAAVALFVLGPVMDFRASTSALGAEARPPDLRVMTANLEAEAPTSPRFLSALREVRPDVVALQECMPERSPIELPGWFTDVRDQICLLSRYPILAVDARDRTDVWNRGGSGAIVLYTIDAPGGPVQLLDVHLETVREGLVGLRHGDVAELRDNLGERAWESELARSFASRATHPLVVAGDFNMPVESAIYGRYWSDFTNAFSTAGLGWGATKRTRLFGVRIDHVLTDRSFTCERAWVGPETGSDHRPMIADLVRAR